MTTHAQTEARAIQRYIAPSAGRGAIVQLLKHCDGEWVRYRDHAAALEAQAAELAAVKAALDCALLREGNEKHRAKVAHQNMNAEIRARERAEAQRDEALKALEPFAKAASEWDGESASLHVFLEWHDSAEPVPSLPVADFRAARRALEAQGGENG